MLQASEPLSPESAATQETSLRELAHWAIGILRRQLLVIALIGAVGTSLGVFYVCIAPSTYTAESRIVIDPRRVQLFPKATFSEGQIDAAALEQNAGLERTTRAAGRRPRIAINVHASTARTRLEVPSHRPTIPAPFQS